MAKRQSINRESLRYEPSKVSWATAKFVEKPPSLAARSFLYMVVAVVTAGILYSALFRVAVSVSVRGKIVTREPSVPVGTAVQFRVAKLRVEEGQSVHAGDILLEGDGRVSDEQLATIEKQHSVLSELLGREKTGRCKSCLDELKAFAPTAFRMDGTGAVQKLLAELRQELLDYISQEDNYRKSAVATSAERMRIHVAESKLSEIRRLHAEARLSNQIDALTNEILAAKSAVGERRQALGLQVSHARNRLEITLSGLIDTIKDQRKAETIVAPASGLIAELTVTGEGQLVSPGTPLMQIVRLDSGIMATLYVPNQEIAQVKPDMHVRLKLDALPEREYGAAKGLIESIPPDVTRGRNADEAVYEVPVVLKSTSLTKDGEEYPFRLGMTLTGLVIVRHESLLMRAARRIFHIQDEIIE